MEQENGWEQQYRIQDSYRRGWRGEPMRDSEDIPHWHGQGAEDRERVDRGEFSGDGRMPEIGRMSEEELAAHRAEERRDSEEYERDAERQEQDAERPKKEPGMDEQGMRPEVREKIQKQHENMERVKARLADTNISADEREQAETERERLLGEGQKIASERRAEQGYDESHMEYGAMSDTDEDHARMHDVETQDAMTANTPSDDQQERYMSGTQKQAGHEKYLSATPREKKPEAQPGVPKDSAYGRMVEEGKKRRR